MVQWVKLRTSGLRGGEEPAEVNISIEKAFEGSWMTVPASGTVALAVVVDPYTTRLEDEDVLVVRGRVIVPVG